MSIFEGILTGFQVALSLKGLSFVFIGVVTGTIIGMIPGLGPITAIAVMIPITYGMDPALALLLMAGVYYGSAYGGAASSILLNAPGESMAVPTTFDGYPLAKQGKAGKALAIAALASFTGGTISVVLLTLFAPFLAKVAISFGPAEYFALMLMGLMTVASFSSGSTIKALISATVGFIIATIGIDSQTGTARYTFGNINLMEGIDFLVIALGLFALAEVTSLIRERKERSMFDSEFGSMKLSKAEVKELSVPVTRQSLLGFIIGVLPGAGGTIASFLGYITEKKLSKKPEEFGKGSIVGLAAPESANNSASSGAFVPLLSLGIPGSGTTAVMLGALIVLGVQPGPLMISDHPDIFWGVIASMYIGNVILLILNLPLIPYISKLLKVPKPMLISLVIMFCIIGVYGISFRTFDLFLLVIFGIIGYFMARMNFPAAPMLLAFILGGMMERSLRQALTISDGSLLIFVQKPISATLLAIAFLSFIVPLLKTWRKKKSSGDGEETNSQAS
ncbi:tripartite tricarboxylate transporter permease [Rossellomorea marisflavi]|uniref:Tripartite tricarboxylate transporter permease n=1 Tax=Rossellomorea marisflavi TaxID=189381 RepID=A0A5D4RV93_9BACI|nr:tripartite tricarboxylate transporter permease [Rossellomorea marisflavi]KQU63652.1 transporter [Bacillus sp. Leaf406]MDW4525779.1 tripartite tricarboxylate transporter permease [Rossellomorea marisflavi]TYS55217.1 tripartite tricarboxylate transporter permease [Rossellomorea marisflavi]UKS66468.1 tripartite tricarboxylate transporter permease [Rossellomorea marisflavi]